MYVCKVCNGIFKRLSGHIAKKHRNLKIDLREYLFFYYGYDICDKYKNGFSANQISKEITEITNGAIKPIKKDILQILKSNNILIRNTSEAIKKWSDKRNGPWNKNLTKEDHPSIMKYAESRRGKNNGYYTGSEESRSKTRYWEYFQKEDLEKIRTKSGDTLKTLYKQGKIIHKSKIDAEWEKKNSIKRLEGYRKYLEDENNLFHGAESKLEKQIAKVLEEKEIKYKKQFRIKHENGFSVYDYLLTDYNIIIEFNGTYWHCDPRKYTLDYYNSSKKMFAKDIWDRDANKKLLAETNNYDMITLWEDDYAKLTSQDFFERVYEAIKNKIDNKK